ncbi:MAG: flagellar biosynthetic protein FliO [Alteromonadaceae bacterium]|nr:MAG: flagellar biosynthetic protein FliO [Alteromonadaceae bacterium]
MQITQLMAVLFRSGFNFITAALIAAGAFSVSTRAYAEEVTSGISLPSAQVGQVVGALLFVTCLIFFFAWLAKKLGAVHLASGQTIKHVATLAVGHREKVVLVDVEGQKILLGVAPGRVACVHVFGSENKAQGNALAYSETIDADKSIVSPANTSPANEGVAENATFMGKKDFSSYIKEILKSNRMS